MKIIFRILSRIFIAMAVIFLLLLAIIAVVPCFDSVSSAEVEGSAVWMAGLEDSIPLNRITLPGAHDCTAVNVFPNLAMRCQVQDIPALLNNGIRYLDVRLADSENDSGLYLSHSFARCREGIWHWDKTICLEDLLSQCYSFLKANPTETIVFAVKHERGPADTASFQLMLNEYISRNEDMWHLSDTIPTLGEARGKIVLMRRHEDEAGLGSAAGISINWIDQDGHSDTSLNVAPTETSVHTLYVQDRFEYSIPQKWAAFTVSNEAGVLENDPDGIFINFLSTKGPVYADHPHRFAARLNASLAEYIESGSTVSGWIIIDFADAEISSAIYSQNFR